MKEQEDVPCDVCGSTMKSKKDQFLQNKLILVKNYNYVHLDSVFNIHFIINTFKIGL